MLTVIIFQNIASQNTSQVHKSSNGPYGQVDISIYHQAIVWSRQLYSESDMHHYSGFTCAPWRRKISAAETKYQSSGLLTI